MKKQPIVVVLLLLLTLAIVFTACTDAPTDVTVDVSVNKFNSLYHKGKFYIDDQQADSFDYSKLFVVTEGDDSVTVTKDMLDVSGLPKRAVRLRVLTRANRQRPKLHSNTFFTNLNNQSTN